MAIASAPVLVLNQNYEPLNVCSVRRAFVLVDRGKAEILENGRGYLHSPTALYMIPSIIRLIYLIRRPRPQGRLTRRDVFLRDRFTCQYCARHTKDLTLDHVLPRHRGGRHHPQKAAGRPLRPGAGDPSRPPFSFYRTFYPYLEVQVEWRKFVPDWDFDGGFA